LIIVFAEINLIEIKYQIKMDLMFDSMPLIYDMIDDDLRSAAMRFNSNDITGCLSDDEQAALSNGYCNLFDDFYFSSPTSSLNSSLSASSYGQSYNSSLTSSGVSSASSSPTCELSPVLQSPISTSPTHSLVQHTPMQLQSSSIFDDINTYSISKFNTLITNTTASDQSQMSSFQTYQTINPSDLNLNYQSVLTNSQHQQQQYLADDHALYHKQVN
jgi:hypothetical protein